MIKVEILKGTDPHLYKMVAPLVMDANVLKKNNNYPFKTSENFIWFVAKDQKVRGFLPVEIRKKEAIMDNYYIEKEDIGLLSNLIKQACNHLKCEYLITSVTQVQHIEAFLENGFEIIREWKNYVKMNRK